MKIGEKYLCVLLIFCTFVYNNCHGSTSSNFAMIDDPVSISNRPDSKHEQEVEQSEASANQHPYRTANSKIYDCRTDEPRSQTPSPCPDQQLLKDLLPDFNIIETNQKLEKMTLGSLKDTDHLRLVALILKKNETEKTFNICKLTDAKGRNSVLLRRIFSTLPLEHQQTLTTECQLVGIPKTKSVSYLIK